MRLFAWPHTTIRMASHDYSHGLMRLFAKSPKSVRNLLRQEVAELVELEDEQVGMVAEEVRAHRLTENAVEQAHRPRQVKTAEL